MTPAKKGTKRSAPMPKSAKPSAKPDHRVELLFEIGAEQIPARPPRECSTYSLPRVSRHSAAPRTWYRPAREGPRCIRPFRWLLGVYGGKPLSFASGGFSAGDAPDGLRCLGKPQIRVTNFAD